MKAEKGWQAKIENKKSSSIEDAKFIFAQAETNLKEIVLAGDLVVSRTTTLITLVVGILVALIGFSINRYYTICSFDNVMKSSITTIIYLFPVLWYLGINMKGTKYCVIGAAPKTLFSDDFFSITEDKEIRSKMFIWAQIENYQDSIETNKETNIKRWKRLNISIMLIMAVPMVPIISFFILSLIF